MKYTILDRQIEMDTELIAAIYRYEELPDGMTVVEEGEWISDGKYEYQDIIISIDGKFYDVGISRTGSYYTDWSYSFEYGGTEKFPQVEQQEVIVKRWVTVKE